MRLTMQCSGMPDSPPPPNRPVRPITPIKTSMPVDTEPSTKLRVDTSSSGVDKMICERCGAAEMYRMHAVWRCPSCGFKTDCCGW